MPLHAREVWLGGVFQPISPTSSFCNGAIVDQGNVTHVLLLGATIHSMSVIFPIKRGACLSVFLATAPFAKPKIVWSLTAGRVPGHS